MTTKQIEETITIPFEDATTAVRASEAQFIHDFLQQLEAPSTLEIGFGYGRSACYIMAATGGKHTVMDPFQDHYNRQALRNVEACGFGENLNFIEDFSHHVLPEMVKQGKKFDFIFIDGDHKFDGIFVDFYYADMLLKPNGFVLFHDTWMRSTQLVMSFVEKNRLDYRKMMINQNNMSLFQKVGEDTRNGMHFREFFTLRRIFKHALIQWIWGPSKGPVKSFVLFLKEKIRPTAKR
ncbi:MAG: class I SAM-dependent methyltransferase [Flavobacteriales bacterium]|jgi:predicted O-methyltransferase YrrM|nr:MAG: class I SAM-dependent methyltransferase [Flavobacteriales bacterium]